MTMNRETLINSILAIALVAVPLIAMGMDEPFIITLATKVAIFAMAGVGLNLVLGFGGLVSFGHAAFFGIGGYAAGILASHALNYEPIMESPFLIEGTTQMIVIWIVALVVSALVALAIGAITLRTSGVYFIMITLAFAQMIYYFAISWPAYGGEDGLSIYVRNGFPGLNTLDPISFFALCAVMLGIVMLFSAVLIRSRFGLALQGARQNAQRMTAVGIAPFRIRLVAFVISAMITALAGALYADLNRFVSPTMLSWHMSGEIMIFVILGGVGRLFGPLAGAALYIILEHLLGGVWEFWQLPLGVLLLIVVLFARGGLVGVLAGERKHA
ncbi:MULTISPECIES: branched-chain amino acid ABC transporter permease [Thalassospira]|jgi:branched-chain amino acid transport system permease protein|uniref:Branched-chain amino acid ABC transporter permease n=1 Tax=Thalassospira povalilytica TaxID=732237 RepID=A0A8I1M6X0_9PROT|nr:MULTISPECIES: branched-chain amino acid ABC transporter permease [Thalassospira]KZB63300.1 ABC transporter permease [Thalassospira sp. MCCC 1A02491]MBN8196408.1 branched-chain amino acid ABC transporter permease [Thalassospira povalilytica]MBO6773153.1 branched-chain amino acid ABC transporter permease [Thalassospira sp.]MCC4241060.1 branched-chain amino acid ABC transporter permease [Thalassospira povalilytica]URK17867.1 branched-chain amino acid ABC transporter permease [Thalassospira sp.|tara:strand:- start:272 stop:1258 length:987 start_codon:yes stop_codon:yes gene_type:complete|eukprot:TRINITY_DN2128_c0_g4_i2.p1 TRINITY_DN2128_c0_g4~~TRINITY_DN2128_c0_g4_i2.p1  ORF type:complete len:329 (-),score=77.83 TRINITY_DN2128_c0_g4_i2:205-1191(-)